MTANEKSQAYHTGYESCVQGEPRTANPYPSGTWDAGEWYAGWDDVRSGADDLLDAINGTAIKDGTYFLFPEGSAWTSASFLRGKLRATSEEGNACNHEAA